MEKIDGIYQIELETLKQIIRDKKDLVIEYFKLFSNESEEKYWINFREDFDEFALVLWLGDKPVSYEKIPKEKIQFLIEDLLEFLSNWRI